MKQKWMKAYQYTIVEPNGEIVRATVAAMFDPYEVQKRNPHSLTYLHLAKGCKVSAYTAPMTLEFIEGPAALMIIEDNYYKADRIPESDHEALQQFKHFWSWKIDVDIQAQNLERLAKAGI